MEQEGLPRLSEKVPTGHFVQESEPSLEYWPTEHREQEVDPILSAYDPDAEYLIKVIDHKNFLSDLKLQTRNLFWLCENKKMIE